MPEGIPDEGEEHGWAGLADRARSVGDEVSQSRTKMSQHRGAEAERNAELLALVQALSAPWRVCVKVPAQPAGVLPARYQSTLTFRTHPCNP